MNQSMHDNLAAKVLKLQALAAKAGSQAEAEACLAKAQKLVDEYGLNLVDVETKQMKDDAEFGEDTLIDCKRTPVEMYPIFRILQAHFHVKIFYQDKWGGGKKYQLFGEKQHVQAAQVLSDQMRSIFRRLLKEYRRETGAGLDVRKAFYKGVETGIRDRLREEDEAREFDASAGSQVAANTTTALAVIDRSLATQFKIAYPRLGNAPKASYRPNWSSDAYASGYRQGQKVNLNQKQVEGRTPNSKRLD